MALVTASGEEASAERKDQAGTHPAVGAEGGVAVEPQRICPFDGINEGLLVEFLRRSEKRCKSAANSRKRFMLHHFVVGVLNRPVQDGDERLCAAELLDRAVQQVRSQQEFLGDRLFEVEIFQLQHLGIFAVGPGIPSGHA